MIEAYLAHLTKGFTPKTLTTRKELTTELERIRRDGVALNQGEWREGVCGVAAPIRDSQGLVVAAMGISGPAERFKAKTLRQFVPLVIDASAKVSRALGYLGQPAARS